MNNNVIIEYVGHLDNFYSIAKLFHDLNYNICCIDFDDNNWKKFNLHEETNRCKLFTPMARRATYRHDQPSKITDNLNITYLTYEQFKNIDIKYIISTNFENREFFKNITNEKPRCIHINQIANNEESPLYSRNILLAFYDTYFLDDYNCCTYIPEHAPYFKPNFNIQKENAIIYDPVYINNTDKPQKYLKLLENNFENTNIKVESFITSKFYSSVIEKIPGHELPDFFNSKKFFFHPKLYDDGYLLRQALSCGLIAILNSKWFKHEKFKCLNYFYCKDKVNFIDINPEVRSFDEVCEIIKEYSDDNIYLKKSKQAYEYTTQQMDFTKFSKKVGNWLNGLHISNFVKNKTFCFDIDGVICSTNCHYEDAIPNIEVIKKINLLYKSGCIITINTSRGFKSGINWSEFTENQLKKWGVKYHKLLLQKPAADYYIDDKNLLIYDFLKYEL
tara:strand:- start:1232 stop:2572 length:1341 start_codon:yes stop_codon:yes gene_type:complete